VARIVDSFCLVLVIKSAKKCFYNNDVTHDLTAKAAQRIVLFWHKKWQRFKNYFER